MITSTIVSRMSARSRVGERSDGFGDSCLGSGPAMGVVSPLLMDWRCEGVSPSFSPWDIPADKLSRNFSQLTLQRVRKSFQQ